MMPFMFRPEGEDDQPEQGNAREEDQPAGEESPSPSSAPEAQLPPEARGQVNGGPLGCCFGISMGLLLSAGIASLSIPVHKPFLRRQRLALARNTNPGNCPRYRRIFSAWLYRLEDRAQGFPRIRAIPPPARKLARLERAGESADLNVNKCREFQTLIIGESSTHRQQVRGR